jgi:hypothetical protein
VCLTCSTPHEKRNEYVTEVRICQTARDDKMHPDPMPHGYMHPFISSVGQKPETNKCMPLSEQYLHAS